MLLQDPAAWRGRQTYTDKCDEFLCGASAAAFDVGFMVTHPFPSLLDAFADPFS